MFNLMTEVYIQSDALNLGAPVGQLGRIVAIDPRIYQALPYLVRVPSKQESWWMPECDLLPYDQWLGKQAGAAIEESLVNRALETGNRELFNYVTTNR